MVYRFIEIENASFSYFDEILKTVPESIEDVIVEADGEWHTTDNIFGTTAWKAQHPVVTPLPKVKAETPPPVKVEMESSKPIVQQKTDVSYILLSDDDEEEVQKELSPSHRSLDSNGPPTPHRNSQRRDNIIDLTLDSDDEEPVPSQSSKRKVGEADFGPASPTEPIWKKGRHEVDYQLPSIATLHASATAPFRQLSIPNNRLPPPQPINSSTSNRYPHYPGTAAPASLYNNLPIRGGSSTPGSFELPSLPGLPPRPSGSWR